MIELYELNPHKMTTCQEKAQCVSWFIETKSDVRWSGKSAQVDYVMCRIRNLKEMCDCKVILNEYVAKQHRMVVCKIVLMVKKKKQRK